MSHEYSVQLYNWIMGELEYVKREKLSAGKTNDKDTEEYFIGKLEELLFFPLTSFRD